MKHLMVLVFVTLLTLLSACGKPIATHETGACTWIGGECLTNTVPFAETADVAEPVEGQVSTLNRKRGEGRGKESKGRELTKKLEDKVS